MPKIITFYNHKGGVSKTTTTFNVAHLLAETGKRTLVVDADPQSNMTEIMMARMIDDLDAQSVEKGELIPLPGTSLLDAIKPRIEGAQSEIDIRSIKLNPINENLSLMKGDVDLNSIEDALAEAHIQRFSTKTHEKRTYVAIGKMLTDLANEYNYDYVLVDVGPSSGALTRSCFLSCDAFFVPVFPDRFNVQAIKTLSKIIDRWLTEHGQVYDDFVKLGLPVRLGKPVFLGTITQQFKLHRAKPKPSYKLWMDRIPAAVETNLLPVLKKHSYEGRDLTFGLGRENVSVTEIPDFQSLAPLMQEWGKAVFQIKQEETAAVSNGTKWSGGTWNDAQARMQDYKNRFQHIADRIESYNSVY